MRTMPIVHLYKNRPSAEAYHRVDVSDQPAYHVTEAGDKAWALACWCLLWVLVALKLSTSNHLVSYVGI